MSGGIIIRRFSVLVTAIKDPCLYDLLGPTDRAKIDAIAAKDPASVTEKDIEHLAALIKVAIHC